MHRAQEVKSRAVVDPVRELWAAVLQQGLEEALGRAADPRLKDPARAWIRATRDNAGSFLWVCAALDIDPDYVRGKLQLNTFREERRYG